MDVQGTWCVNKTATLEHRGKTHVLNVKLKGELPPERPEDHAIDLISGVAHQN